MALFYIFANLCDVCLGERAEMSCLLLLSCYLKCMKKNQTLHKYVVGKREGFLTFSEICGCFSLMAHLDLTSDNFSKLSYSVESEITLVNFLKPISLFARIDLSTSCFSF